MSEVDSIWEHSQGPSGRSSPAPSKQEPQKYPEMETDPETEGQNDEEKQAKELSSSSAPASGTSSDGRRMLTVDELSK